MHSSAEHEKSLITSGPGQSSQGTLWVAKDPKRLQADSKDSDQHARVHMLTWVFFERTCSLVGNAVSRLIMCCNTRYLLGNLRETVLFLKVGWYN